MVGRGSGYFSRPESRESDVDDGGLGETLWRNSQRAAIKKGTAHALSRPTTGDVGLGVPKAPQVLPPLRQRPICVDADQRVKQLLATSSEELTEGELLAKRAERSREAKAQAAACWQDMISFLELHKLPGAYALAFAAYGVEDLSSLLLLDDADLSSLLDKCSIDCMDEILLLEAVKDARPPAY